MIVMNLNNYKNLPPGFTTLLKTLKMQSQLLSLQNAGGYLNLEGG